MTAPLGPASSRDRRRWTAVWLEQFTGAAALAGRVALALTPNRPPETTPAHAGHGLGRPPNWSFAL